MRGEPASSIYSFNPRSLLSEPLTSSQPKVLSFKIPCDPASKKTSKWQLEQAFQCRGLKASRPSCFNNPVDPCSQDLAEVTVEIDSIRHFFRACWVFGEHSC
ncbi:hypothetical protein CLAIMM_13774 isoform 1 [Cladophialophora immunda]|nr:hypothetical protein CLAIMM_13774 isoform 1 [Cladophialophora immunda]